MPSYMIPGNWRVTPDFNPVQGRSGVLGLPNDDEEPTSEHRNRVTFSNHDYGPIDAIQQADRIGIEDTR